MPETKRCSNCGEEKPVEAFNRNRKSKDGCHSRCRPCQSAYQREWRAANPEKNKAQLERWRKKNPTLLFQASQRYKKRNPERVVAHNAVKYAVRVGKLTRPDACEECGGGGRIEAHHDDYAKKLDVRWLCHSCHCATKKRPPGRGDDG